MPSISSSSTTQSETINILSEGKRYQSLLIPGHHENSALQSVIGQRRSFC